MNNEINLMATLHDIALILTVFLFLAQAGFKPNGALSINGTKSVHSYFNPKLT